MKTLIAYYAHVLRSITGGFKPLDKFQFTRIALKG